VVSSPLWTTLVLLALVVTAFLMFQRGLGSIRHSSSTEPPKAGSQDFVLLLFATGALLTLSVEYVYLKDHFYTRMNTVFKFYFQTWVLWAIAGAYALSAYIRNGKVLISAVAVLLIAAGLIYPILAIPSRAEEQGGLVTLDGASYLAQVRPNDYAAIEWLNDNVVGAPTILEAPGHSYDYEGRVSAHTGLPTVLGWAGHEGQWRGDYQEQSRREPDIEVIYTSVDANHVLALLDRYNVSYVYVGSVERGRYPEDGVAKFAGLLDTVYDTGSVTIYQVSR
jgi:YYY domain-containing protein